MRQTLSGIALEVMWFYYICISFTFISANWIRECLEFTYEEKVLSFFATLSFWAFATVRKNIACVVNEICSSYVAF